MKRPLKLDTSTTPVSLKEMTDAEITANIILPILQEFAGDEVGTGTLKVSTVGGTGTLAGTWSDRTRIRAVGYHGSLAAASQYSTTKYSVYQNLSETNESAMVRPLCFKYAYEKIGTTTRTSTTVTLNNTTNITVGMDVYGTGIPANTVVLGVTSNSIEINNAATSTAVNTTISFRRALVSMSDDDLYTYIIGPALTNMVNQGLGSYYLSSNAPSTPSGGTWTSKFSFTDTWRDGSSSKTVWRLTGLSNIPSISVRPITFTEKDVNVLGDEGLIEMSDFQIKSLVSRFKNSIVSTGIGQYTFDTLAPSTGGTWSTVGESITDYMNTIVEETYARNYTGFYTAYYRKTYFGTYTGQYVQGSYAGSYAANLGTFGSFIRWGTSYTGSYIRYLPKSYTGSYISYRQEAVDNTFTAYFTGQTISSSLTSIEQDALWIRVS